ncbi:MAG: glycosyltransferase [Promethearchaeota archaeon]
MNRNIVWIGRFRGYSGFSNSTREYFKSLLPYYENLYLAPLEVLEPADPLRKYLAHLPLNDTELKVVNHVPITEPEAEVYFSVTEYNTIPDEWAEIFNQSRMIFTQSRFCKEAFSTKIEDPTKIHVIPYVIPENFLPEGPKSRYFTDDVFVFGSVFEWVPRKVPDRTIRAFVNEFRKDEPVRLLLKTSHPSGINVKDLVKKITNDSRITVISEPIVDMASFYRGLDAYISCTAGEGWGQTLSEAMACGLPVIGSRHSGNLDFMNDSNSYLVDVHDWSPVEKDSELCWKLPREDSIEEVMRKVYSEKGSAIQEKKTKKATLIRDDYTREKIGFKMKTLLDGIL